MKYIGIEYDINLCVYVVIKVVYILKNKLGH